MKSLNSNNFVRSNALPEYVSSEKKHFSKSIKLLRYSTPFNWLFLFTLFSCFTALLSLFYVLFRLSIFNDKLNQPFPFIPNAQKIAVASNFYKPSSSDFWWKTLIQNNPDILIWAGNFAYLGINPTDCSNIETINNTDCLCQFNLLPPQSCSHANSEEYIPIYQRNFYDNGYNKLLQHMCPGKFFVGYPVYGLDCKHPILATYGTFENSLKITKNEKKNLFLDLFGEYINSNRRSLLQGLEKRYIFNKNDPLKEISIFLLDDQFYADDIPCPTLKNLCKKAIESENTEKFSETWINYCKNSIPYTTCCVIDDFFWNEEYGYCYKSSSQGQHNLLLENLCDVNSPFFGENLWDINEKNVILSNYGQTNFCEIFGLSQRKWLSKSLHNSTSRINFIVTSSPIFDNSESTQTDIISIEKWRYKTKAQQNFLNILGYSGASCIILLSGGTSKAEIQTYKAPSPTSKGQQHSPQITIYQITSGSITENFINNWKKNPFNAQLNEKCANSEFCFYDIPSFGMVDIDWDNLKMHLQLMNSTNGKILKEIVVNLHDCTP